MGIASINTVSTLERVNHLAISPIPDLSLSFDYPLTKDNKHFLKVLLSFGDISEEVELSNPIESENLLPHKTKYDLAIYYVGTHISYQFYHLGLGFGIRYPLSGKTEYPLNSKDLSLLFDSHISYYLPLLKSNSIEIELVSKINFALSGQLKNYPESDPFILFEKATRSPLNKKNNPQPISFGIGFLFKYNFLK